MNTGEVLDILDLDMLEHSMHGQYSSPGDSSIKQLYYLSCLSGVQWSLYFKTIHGTKKM